LKVTLQTLKPENFRQAEGLACADPRSRTPISVSGNYDLLFICVQQSVIRVIMVITINQRKIVIIALPVLIRRNGCFI
jgi:hypothetical protein